jgi:hypothetical protein
MSLMSGVFRYVQSRARYPIFPQTKHPSLFDDDLFVSFFSSAGGFESLESFGLLPFVATNAVSDSDAQCVSPPMGTRSPSRIQVDAVRYAEAKVFGYDPGKFWQVQLRILVIILSYLL